MVDVPMRIMRQARAFGDRAYRSVLCLLVFSTVIQFANYSEAAPIQIRARSSIEHRIERSDSGIQLRGRLLSEIGRPIPHRPIHVGVEGLMPPKMKTAEDGSFQVLIESEHLLLLEAKEGRFLPWSVEFSGDAAYGAAGVTGTMDLLRTPTWLHLEGTPNPVHIASDDLRIKVTAHAGEERTVGGAEIQLQVADGPLLTGQAGENGEAVFLVRSLAIGDEGVLQVNAYFRGNDRHAASSASINVRLSNLTRTTLRVGREGPKSTGRYRFSGRVSYSAGPIHQATVNIVASGVLNDGTSDKTEEVVTRIVAVGSTDTSGVYLATVTGDRLFADFDKVMEIRALAVPDADRYSASTSPSIEIAVPVGQFVPARLYLVALAWVLALLLLFQLVRRGGWRRGWTAFLAKRRARRLRVWSPVTPAFVEAEPVTGERRPDWVAGRVIARYSKRPIGGARVELQDPQGLLLTTSTNALGGFEIGPVPPGGWHLSLEAKGHENDSSPLEIPHQGQFDGARFLLTSRRHTVRLAFGEWLRDAGMAWRWGHETLRDAGTVLAATRPELLPELEERIELVESVWYQDTEVKPRGGEQAGGAHVSEEAG
jgi:hypothetical protein